MTTNKTEQALPDVPEHVERIWRDFWADIVAPHGVIDISKVKLELSDFHGLLEEVPKVYMHVTGGRISKPHTLAREVISVHDDYISELVGDEIKDSTQAQRADEMHHALARIEAWDSHTISLSADKGSNGVRDFYREIARAALARQPEPVVRFCPGCGSVGEVPNKYRDCCPDGSHARMIPESLAHRCRDLFRLALDAAQQTDPVAAVPAGWKLVKFPPTEEMLAAGGKGSHFCMCCGYDNGPGDPGSLLELMAFASPSPPDANGNSVEFTCRPVYVDQTPGDWSDGCGEGPAGEVGEA